MKIYQTLNPLRPIVSDGRDAWRVDLVKMEVEIIEDRPDGEGLEPAEYRGALGMLGAALARAWRDGRDWEPKRKEKFSEKKAASSRAYGKKGGRPRKKKTVGK